MAIERIEKDMNIVKLLTAQALGQKVESDKAEEAAKEIATLSADLSPTNRHLIAQLIAYGVNGMAAEAPNFFREIADYKQVNEGDVASFDVPVGDIKAVIQAKSGTTPRSRIAQKNVVVDTFSVSARPSLNMAELRSGRKDMATMIRKAYRAIELEKMGHVQSVLVSAISGYSSPFFAQGSGVVGATLDAMLVHFRRNGNALLMGDLAVLDKLALLAGFIPASVDPRYSGNTIEFYHQTGAIGAYRGTKVQPIANAFKTDGVTPVLDPAYIYIMNLGTAVEDRSLKVVEAGPVNVIDDVNIDDRSYDTLLEQDFGAAFVVGTVPTLGVYEDQTL